MFGLTLVDHLRLTFGHVIYTHRAHTQLAWRHARWNRWAQGAEALLMLVAALASVALVFSGETAYGIASATAASLGVCALIVRLVFDFDQSASAHRVCSARLWAIREQYRALLSDVKDETVTLDGARERRDVLMSMLHAVYEHAPPADSSVYDAARRAVPDAQEVALTDAELDRFLPVSLQKSPK
jgi:hypothetical protein